MSKSEGIFRKDNLESGGSFEEAKEEKGSEERRAKRRQEILEHLHGRKPAGAERPAETTMVGGSSAVRKPNRRKG